MKLYIKQRVFSFKDSFVVKDETGQDKYFVEGEFLSLGHRLHIRDGMGDEVGFIRQKLMTFMPKFELYVHQNMIGELVKEFTFFTPSYHIQGSNMTLEGDFLNHEYVLKQGDNTIMYMSKEWFTWGDSYVLDIPSAEHELLSLCTALAIDCEMCSNDK